MQTQDVIKNIMSEQEIGLKEMCFRMTGDSSTPSRFVHDRLNKVGNRGMCISTINEMLNVLGYKVVAVPCSTPTKKDWFELE